MDLKNIHKSQTVRGILIGLGVGVIILIIFQAGQVVGYRKARFAGNFGNNFERNFLGPREGSMRVMLGNKIPGGHGAVGEIININLPQLIVAGPDNLEKVVSIGTSTIARRFQDEISVSDLKVGEFVVVLGNPNDAGQIEAKLIRIMPSPRDEFNKIKPQ